MQLYKNLSGNSGVVAFNIGDCHIDIEFKGSQRYRYDYETPGRQEVETMKSLAMNGKGLATFISQNVKDRFSAKLP